jgi:hypothetical protein
VRPHTPVVMHRATTHCFSSPSTIAFAIIAQSPISGLGYFLNRSV